MGRGLLAAIAFAAIALTAAGASSDAAVTDGANVRVSFKGWMTPEALPRDRPAPVALHLRGSLRTTNGQPPPQLKRMTFEINRFGIVSTKGLPVCHERELTATSSATALANCRDALIGTGSFTAHILIPTQPPFPSYGRLLAFNTRIDGKPAILGHVYGVDPLPTSRVMRFRFTRNEGGTFGTALSLEIPELGDDWGHVKGFRLDIFRRYRHAGEARSVVSASCPAPAGFGSALFTAARGTYFLASGQRISRLLTGKCRVRD